MIETGLKSIFLKGDSRESIEEGLENLFNCVKTLKDKGNLDNKDIDGKDKNDFFATQSVEDNRGIDNVKRFCREIPQMRKNVLRNTIQKLKDIFRNGTKEERREEWTK